MTTEANPDSVSAQDLRDLAAAGFTRVSFGMQSAVPQVLDVEVAADEDGTAGEHHARDHWSVKHAQRSGRNGTTVAHAAAERAQGSPKRKAGALGRGVLERARVVRSG